MTNSMPVWEFLVLLDPVGLNCWVFGWFSSVFRIILKKHMEDTSQEDRRKPERERKEGLAAARRAKAKAKAKSAPESGAARKGKGAASKASMPTPSTAPPTKGRGGKGAMRIPALPLAF